MPVKISIITACLNAEEHIEQTIQSIVNQGYENLEYIIVDGGSKDRTLSIIKKYEGQISHWISEPDRGISDAFNKGIQLSTGSFIGIISADDYLMPGALEKIASEYDAFPETDVFFGDALGLEPENKIAFVQKSNHKFNNIWWNQPLLHVSVFVSRKTYENLGTFKLEYKLAMDYELILRFFIAGVKFRYIPYTMAAIRLSGISIRNPYRTIREVRKISISHGFNPVFAYLISYYKILYMFVRRILQKGPLIKIVNLYRKLSPRYKKWN